MVMGKPSKADIEACWNLGATVAAQLMDDLGAIDAVASVVPTLALTLME